MREIVFRGKAANREKGRSYRTSYKNGDWVYGLLTDTENYAGFAEMTNTDGVCGIEVDKNTVGQFTGLTDRTGKKIFESDICEDTTGVIFTVEWDRENGRYLGFTVGARRLIYVGREPKVLVVGNIYDNPEKLEVCRGEA